MTTRIVARRFSEEHREELERVACPCCGRDDAVVHRVSHDRLFGLPGNYHVVRCRACSMMYTNPRPASLGRHYPNDYFCYDPPETQRGFRGFLLRMATRGLVDRRMGLLERVSGRLAEGTRVCDVGCSHGQLLRALRDGRGCRVVGVDFSPEMVDYCRGVELPIVEGTLDGARFARRSFDVLTMTEYLEHEPDPRRVLDECRRVVADRGYLAIEVPLISSPASRLFGNFWSQLDLPRHLMFFTEESITRMLEESGFEVVKIWKCYGSIGFSLLHALGYEKLGRLTALDMVLSGILTVLLAPLLPFMQEFMYVIARAAPAEPTALPALPSAPRQAVANW
jgi:2-polyprenyl-3-methyl-5-hydroxy-6-metoxy-1,4-benzoquinol methylase